MTFRDASSVLNVMENLPITNGIGGVLTVTIAARNTKPRRATFTVSHGSSNQVEDAEKALLRTANIQNIKPAKLFLDDDSNEKFGFDASVHVI